MCFLFVCVCVCSLPAPSGCYTSCPKHRACVCVWCAGARATRSRTHILDLADAKAARNRPQCGGPLSRRIDRKIIYYFICPFLLTAARLGTPLPVRRLSVLLPPHPLHRCIYCCCCCCSAKKLLFKLLQQTSEMVWGCCDAAAAT